MKANLDKSLISFTGEETCITIRDLHNSCFITGNVGSGKTTGSACHVISKLMENDYGMVFLTVKADEAELYRKLARKAGREHQVVEVSPDHANYFNFIQYFASTSDGFSYATNVYQILKTAIKTSETQAAGREHDAFFSQSVDRTILSIIELCLLSDGELSVERIYEIAQSMPKAPETEAESGKESISANDQQTAKAEDNAFTYAFALAKEKSQKIMVKWRSAQDENQLRTLSKTQIERKMRNDIPEYRKYKMLHQFFMETMFRISSKTRSIIQMCIINFLGSFLDEPMYSLFCKNESTFTPDDCITKGSIVILNLPVMLYSKSGQDIQTLMKLCFQKAWQRRNVKENSRSIALVSDECQYFICDTDALFQTTSRALHISVVYITQNLSNLYANMSGVNTEHHVNSLLATLGVRFFHANAHMDSNRLVSDMAGQAFFEDISRSISFSKDSDISNSFSYKLESHIRPEEMLSLKCGGELNDFITECYVFIQGKQFSGNRNFKKVKFKQSIL